TGPAVIPGKSGESYVVQLIEGKVDGLVMPMKGPRLTDEEIQLVRDWIDQGFEWDKTQQSRETRRAPLAPRKPALPAGDKATANPIDLLLQAYLKEHKVDATKLTSDAVYARRVWLDITGLLPDPKQLEEFIADRAPDKREKLVDRLLDDNRAYAENWMTFWNDILRNDFAGTGYIDGGRKQITGWLYESLARNKPYDQFVRELIHPTAQSEGFIKGIVWRGVTNASQTPAMQAAQNIGQIFMGTNLKCASCHDSFVNQWKLKDTYGLASVFADEPLELIRCDVPQGEMAQMHFLYPELGEIDPTAPRDKRTERVAELVTKPENGRFARTIVNRLWAKFMGRGLVEPLDDMDQEPWNQDVLDWLASDLSENKYDLKRTMKLILTSRAYQMPAVGGKEIASADYVFEGPVVRRLSIEQIADSFSCLTGVWQERAGAKLDLDLGSARPEDEAINKGIRETIAPAKWIWRDADAAKSAPAETVYFRKTIKIPDAKSRPLSEAVIFITCDNNFTLYVNGEQIADGNDWTKLPAVDLRGHLNDGANTIAVEAGNTIAGPAGLFAFAMLRRGGEKFDFAADASWLCSAQKFNDWEKPGFFPLDWPDAAVVKGLDGWNIETRLVDAVRSEMGVGKIRAWLALADPLMRALGRPNREQVMTRRQSVATTLEAIELTNGETLSAMLGKGAQRILENPAAPKNSPDALAAEIYFHALGRKPTSSELEIARSLIGAPVKPEGIEDFLWAFLMSPEFQLIY
ncbi:DUF1549 domain-containing protein, partial [Candidatus Sumerlaeota bacterium]|nr:DUF1549 domain-containing protein [Candidatus Sumerlaeota bacterium]